MVDIWLKLKFPHILVQVMEKFRIKQKALQRVQIAAANSGGNICGKHHWQISVGGKY
jgi:hypothetical protein